MSYLYNNKKLKSVRKQLRNNMSQPEQILWYWLRGQRLNGYKFRRQYSIGNIVVDFYCPKARLAIEIDGDSHFVGEIAQQKDIKRDQFLISQGIKVVRFKNSDVSESIDGVTEIIISHLPPLTPPVPGGE